MYHCFFRHHVCLSNLKHALSCELPLTTCKTVFSHLNPKQHFTLALKWKLLTVSSTNIWLLNPNLYNECSTPTRQICSFPFFTLFCPIACVTSMACWLVVCQDPLPVPGQELILKWKILCLENLFYSNSVWSRASHRGIAVSLSKESDVPFKYLFWVILVHFKLCFKRKRNKEMKFYFSSCIIFLEQYLFIISND